MKLFGILLKHEFTSFFASMFKKSKLKTTTFLALTIVGALGLSSIYSINMLKSLDPSQYYLVPYVFALASCFLIVVSSSSTKGFLFGFKDFDLLMSLPIKKEYIMLTKLFGFIMSQFLYVVLTMVPALLIYGIYAGMDFNFYLLSFLGLPFFYFIAILISVIIGLLIKYLSGKSKYENLFSTIMSILFTVLIFFISFKMNDIDKVSFMKYVVSFIDYIKLFLPTVYLYINGSINSNYLQVIISVFINLSILMLTTILFSKSFLKLNSINNEGYKVKNFKIKNSTLNSTRITLFKKEMFRFLSNFMYVLNMSMGTIMLVIGSFYLLFNQNIISEILMEVNLILDVNTLPVYLLALITVLSSMTCITCVSISLEGLQIWISKTLPIDTFEIFLSKILVNFIIIVVPSLLSYSIFIVLFKIDLYWLIVGLIYIVLLAMFVSMIGIIINLFFPKINFDREIQVIKQSISSFVGIFLNLFVSLGISYFLVNMLDQNYPILTIFIGATFYLILDVCFYIWLKKYGVRRFLDIN